MKYILIIGRANDGKSSTMREVCRRLAPTQIWQFRHADRTFQIVDNTHDIVNGSYLTEVAAKIILVVAGAPTEQRISITALLKICIELNIKIELALVSMRSFEKTEGYDTKNELRKVGECLLEERIWRIDAENF
ncbi:MAG: hypothetical protein JST19_12035, partial [Bacteroidetes bacterium]|nr:hypothetical protein [Bacteroidota bacterium]